MIKCLICEKEFEEEVLARHIAKKHKVLYKDYYLKYVCNNIVPKCKCGCGKETNWNIFYKRFTEYRKGHSSFGKHRTEDQKKRISEKNSVHAKQRLKDNPHVYDERLKKAQLAGHSEKARLKRIETLNRTYSNMSVEEKKKFSEHTKRLWENGTLSKENVKKAMVTWKKRYENGDYGDFVERNEKISKTITELIIHEKLPFCKGIYYSEKMKKEIKYKSSWELEFAKLLDNDVRVKEWEYEKVVIPYLLEGKKRRYVPDFKIKLFNEEIILIEVKPKILETKLKINQEKFLAAKEFCKKNNWKFYTWELNEVLPF